jgi:uncharacterized protein
MVMNESALDRDQLQNLLKDFMAQHGADYHLQKIGFFGSYARDQATAESDVDIVFTTDRPNLLTTSAMKQDLEVLLGRKVDVIRLHQYLSPAFRDRIEREAVYICQV